MCVFITAGPTTKLFPGTREEPGTLTQDGALFSLVPLVWESTPIFGDTIVKSCWENFKRGVVLKISKETWVFSTLDLFALGNISFLPAIMTTSSRMHSEFLRLLFLQAHRETTAHFIATGLPSQQTRSDNAFQFNCAAFYMGLKSKVGLVAAKGFRSPDGWDQIPRWAGGWGCSNFAIRVFTE